MDVKQCRAVVSKKGETNDFSRLLLWESFQAATYGMKLIQNPTASLNWKIELGVCKRQAAKICRAGYQRGESWTKRFWKLHRLKSPAEQWSTHTCDEITQCQGNNQMKWSERTIPRAHTELGTFSVLSGQNGKVIHRTSRRWLRRVLPQQLGEKKNSSRLKSALVLTTKV